MCWTAYFSLPRNGISEETRPLATGDVKVDHKYVGYEGTRRIHPAQDRVHWRFVDYGGYASRFVNIKNLD